MRLRPLAEMPGDRVVARFSPTLGPLPDGPAQAGYRAARHRGNAPEAGPAIAAACAAALRARGLLDDLAERCGRRSRCGYRAWPIHDDDTRRTAFCAFGGRGRPAVAAHISGSSGEPAVMAGGACSSHAAAVSAGAVIAPRRTGGFGRAADTRPPAGAHPSRMPGQPPCVGQHAAQQELDLGVCAAQFVGGPPGQGVMNGRIQLSLSVADRMVER